MKSRYKSLSPDEASRALYVDFEGRTGHAPVLLGRTRRTNPGKVWQVITDPLFDQLAMSGDIGFQDLPHAVGSLVAMAEKRKRRIVAWSEHELNIVATYCPEHYERFEARYVNARALAERWRNKCHGGEKPPTSDLATYLSWIGYHVPPNAGNGHVGKTIGDLRKPLERGKTYDDLTAKQRARWQNLRDHNRHDCTGMRTLCLKAAAEIVSHTK